MDLGKILPHKNQEGGNGVVPLEVSKLLYSVRVRCLGLVGKKIKNLLDHEDS